MKTTTTTDTVSFTLRDADGSEKEVQARDVDHAQDLAESWIAGGDYDLSRGTTWVDVDIMDEAGELVATHTVTLDPEEPDCTEDEHDWQSPHELVGGIAENPGVRGHGGGVIVLAVCMHCGCLRTTDTWAQRPDTGRQGLTSVRYEPGRYAAEVEALRDAEA